MKRLGTAGLIVLSLLGMGSNCDELANPDGPQKVTVRIGSGTMLGKSNYGLWQADNAEASCRWTVTKDGRTIAGGGRHDSLLSGTATKGGILHASHCGYFTK